MSILVVSDTHGDVSSWSHIFEIINMEELDIIIHAGDVLYHGPRNPIKETYDPGRLSEEINKLDMPIFIAAGNCDSEVDDMVLSPIIQSSPLFLHIAGRGIVVHHGHNKTEDDLLNVAQKFKADIIIYGHSHIRKNFKLKDILFLNPGSTSLPKTEDGIPTFALLENNVIKLYNLNSGEIIEKTDIT